MILTLKAASSRQSTSISEDRFSKSIKLLNSSLFENSLQNVNNWLSRMWNKLKTNKNHFSIEELKIVYIESRVSEAAIKHIASCMQDIFLNSFLKVEEVLLIINKMYDDFNHYHTTQRQYLKLYQNKIFFHEFWMKFQRFSAELEYNNKTLLNDLQHKISSDLQRATFNEQITNLNEFINICMQVDVRLTELNARSVVKASVTQAAHSVVSTSTIWLTSSVSSWKKFRRSKLNFIQKELFKKEFCFKCKKSEHRAYDCLKTTQVHEIAARLIVESSFHIYILTRLEYLSQTFWLDLNTQIKSHDSTQYRSQVESELADSTQLVKQLNMTSRELNIEIFPVFRLCITFLHYLFNRKS